MIVRECEEIVKLLQQKNLLNEFYGRRFIKVGEIEERVGYRMRVSRGPIDDKDYFERKLETECLEGDQITEILEREMDTSQLLNGEMRAFLNEAQGNPQWDLLVRARWLRKRQQNQANDFDPTPDDIIPVFV